MPPIDRLSALDAAFLDLDSDTAPLHVGWTIRVDGRAPSLSALRRHVESRLEHVPRFRRRVLRPRLGLGDAHWADDASFDIARHVHAVALAPPGGPGELRALAGALLSRPLDRSHPLWRMYLVTGVRGGGWAVIGQAHHALVDGIAAVEVAMLLFDAAGHEPMRSAPARWQPQAPPSAHAAAVSFARSRVVGAARAARSAAATVGHGANVPGPPVELDVLGRRVTAIYPAVPFVYGHALSIGALSYRGRLHCGVYADADVVPDAAEIAHDLERAFDALRIAPRPYVDTPWRARARSRRQRAAKR